jgi:formylglycine-generating enzyme required for sulfatase activity
MGKAEYFQLMEQLHTWHIDVNRFVEDWYGLEKTTGSDSTLPTPPSTGIVIPPVTIPALPKFDFKSVRLNAKGEIVEEFNGQASYLQENLDNGAVLEMVKLPGGSFKMGISEEEAEVARKEMQRYGVSAENARAWTENAKPQHEVKITGFYMGKYVVTQGQWRMVAGWPKVKMELKPDPSYFKGDDLPVEQVSWEEAEEFCERLSRKTGKRYRLPTEAEWEYACRAGRTTPYAFGETITPEIVNYNGNYPYGEAPKGEYRGKTTAMGSLGIANEFGLYDMHGNVWEWCSDWYGAYSSSKSSRIEQDASGTTSGSYRVMRGGGWYNSAVYCRSAYRGYDTPDHRDSDVGFRLVRTLE